MRLLLMILSLGLFVLPVYAGTIAEEVAELGLTDEQLLKMGEAIFNTEGANTCLKCHGPGGHGGDQAGAADLRHPKTWRSYQFLGGDEALAANKEQFLKNMDTVIHELISGGATAWNLKFARTHKDIDMDWSKVTIPDKVDKYNSMMKGLTSGPMKDAVKTHLSDVQKNGKKLKTSELRDVAAVADFHYVKSFDDGSDKGGVFK